MPSSGRLTRSASSRASHPPPTRTIHVSAASSGPGLSLLSASRPARRDSTRPASRSAARCLAIAWRVTGRPAASWVADASRSASASSRGGGAGVSSQVKAKRRSGARPPRPRRSSPSSQRTGLHPARSAVGPGAPTGSIGDCFDDAVIGAFWTRLRVELLNTRRWKLASNSPARCSSTSRSSTTASAAAPASACAPRSSTKCSTPTHQQ